MLLILKQATVRIILQKKPPLRTEKEIDYLIKYLQDIDFFKSNKDLSYGDFRDLTMMLHYREYDADTIIYSKGDVPDNFYIVLNGSVVE